MRALTLLVAAFALAALLPLAFHAVERRATSLIQYLKSAVRMQETKGQAAASWLGV